MSTADASRDNATSLRARIVERGAQRYTPAGLPAIDLVLRHEGEASEAGSTRRVTLDIKAKAIGADLIRQVAAVGGASDAIFTGFLAATRNGRGVVFHLNTIDPVESRVASVDD